MAQTDKERGTVQAVDRALAIIETLAENGTMSLRDLNKKLGVNKPSLSRLTNTLVQDGYISQDEVTGAFTLSMKCYEVGISAIQNLNLMSLVNTTLMDISKETGWIAQFSIEDRNQLLFLQSIGQQENSIKAYASVGKRSPLYATSAGKALLSTYSNAEILDRWDAFDIKPLTTHTITDRNVFLEEIADIRNRGYAADCEESEYGLFCLGAVVRGAMGNIVGAVSISGSSINQNMEDKIAEVLLRETDHLSTILGNVTSGSAFGL